MVEGLSKEFHIDTQEDVQRKTMIPRTMKEDDAADWDGSAVLRASKAVINFKSRGKKLEPKVKPQMAFTPEDARAESGSQEMAQATAKGSPGKQQLRKLKT
ncbi:hypothetical protein BGZ65_009901 [Modicella reniformis]|uniref:Uncharacterized protein n=1 Tax=Modicella reniformis TaxID=1440133 RepID=A0A9P6LWB3_9FUNG|nr:hypothetical protein BGZ65_009901 [Modicella reniformis]